MTAGSRCWTTYAGWSTPTASSASRCWRPVRAPARASTPCATRSRAGSARRRSPAPGWRPTYATRPCGCRRPPAPARTRSCRRNGSPRSRTPSPMPRGCRRSSRPSSPRPASAAAGPPAGRSRPGCPGSAPTRSSGCTSTSARTARASPAGAAPRSPPPPRPAGARRRRGPGRRRRGLRPAGAGRGRSRYAAPRSPGCPTSATGSTPHSPPPTSASSGCPRGPGSCVSCSGCCCSPRRSALVWSAVLLADPWFGVDRPSTPDIGGFPVPVVLLLGGVLLGPAARAAVPVPGLGHRPVPGPRRRPAAALGHLRGGRRAGRGAGARRAGGLRHGARGPGPRPQVSPVAVHSRPPGTALPQALAVAGPAVGARCGGSVTRSTRPLNDQEMR